MNNSLPKASVEKSDKPNPLRRTEIDPLSRGKSMMHNKKLNNENIGYFGQW